MALRPQTALLHQQHWSTAGFEGVQPGVFRASTVFFPSMAAWRNRDWTAKNAYIYGPHGTPTTFELEARIAQLEGAEHALLAASGLNAIALVYMAFLRPGDEVLVPVNVYPANRTLLTAELASWGVRPVVYDPCDPSTMQFSSTTRLVWIEAPCAITMEYPDVPAIAAAAREAGVLTALDNTWGAGIAFRPFELGVDISVHALTKYANGAADVVMGSISMRDKSLYDTVKRCSARLGLHVSADEAAAVLRGLQTLAVRYAAHDRAGRILAEYLRCRDAVTEVFHPALPGAKGHALWKRDCTASAGILSVVFNPRYSQLEIDSFVDALRLFRIGFSWGGPISMVLSYGREVASTRPIEGELVRFSAGLEAPEDLIDDLAQALEHLA